MMSESKIEKLQFSVAFGTLGIIWKSFPQPNSDTEAEPSSQPPATFRIQRIEWSKEQSGSVCSADSIPRLIWELSEGLKAYAASGEPLNDQYWGDLEQSEWTEFQKKVYQAISRIPFGETRSYAWVAQKIGKPNASRAVGQALRKNPLPILIPCHRVTAVNSLGGFMGIIDPGEPATLLKQKLIELEERYVNPFFSFLNESA